MYICVCIYGNNFNLQNTFTTYISHNAGLILNSIYITTFTLDTIWDIQLFYQQCSNLPYKLDKKLLAFLKIHYSKYLNHLQYNIPVTTQFTVFFELRSRKAVHILEQIMSMYIFELNRGYCLFNGFLHSSTKWLFFVSNK